MKAMTVGELIEKLKEFDPDLPVELNLGFDGPADLECVELQNGRGECYSQERGLFKDEIKRLILS